MTEDSHEPDTERLENRRVDETNEYLGESAPEIVLLLDTRAGHEIACLRCGFTT